MSKTYESSIAMPRPDVFETRHAIDSSLLNAGNGAMFPILDRVEYPEKGGIEVWFKGMPYPRKGFPYPEAVHSNDMLKRLTLTGIKMISGLEMVPSMLAFAILPWRLKIKAVNRTLENYARVVDWMVKGSYLTENRYCPSARALRKVVKNFLLVLGVNPQVAEDLSKAAANTIEYDDAYRYRLQDIFSETRQMRLALYPVSEVKRLGKLYAKREKTHAIGSVGPMFRLASLAFIHPKIRKAWKVALTHITADDFKGLQLDNADRYHVLSRNDYDFTGRTFEERSELFKDVHRGSMCCEAKVRKLEKPVLDEGKPPKAYECLKCGRPVEEAYAFPQYQEIVA